MIYRRGDSPHWWMRLEREGKPLRENTRVPVDAPTKKERVAQYQLADRIYRARMGDLARSRFALPVDRPTIGFTSYATWYVTHYTDLKRTKLRERSAVATLTRHFLSRFLHTIDEAAVVEWRVKRAKQVKAATVNRELDILKHMLAKAVPKYLERSPIVGMRRLRAVRPVIRIFTEAEEARFLAAATDPEALALMLMGRDTLMRLSDIARLEWADDHGTYLDVIDPKGGQPYTVAVTSRLRAALDALPTQGPYVFPSRQEGKATLSLNTIRGIFTALCTAAQVPAGRANGGVTFHTLRHTGTTRALDGGANPRAVMEQGGWTSLRQLERYAHVTEAGRRQLAAVLEGGESQPVWRTDRKRKRKQA